jgi:hypothetical protein
MTLPNYTPPRKLYFIRVRSYLEFTVIKVRASGKRDQNRTIGEEELVERVAERIAYGKRHSRGTQVEHLLE